MTPIYKYELTVSSITQVARPIYGDRLEKSFEKESGQEFFREKISGDFTFEKADYELIESADFSEQMYLQIYISYDAGQTWEAYWRGTFWKTDCEFDMDAETVVVTPTAIDRYNNILAGLEKEFNLIELAPEITRVNADKRPVIQVYVPGQTVVGCFLSGMWWEQECEAVTRPSDLTGKYHFSLNKRNRIIDITQTGSPVLPDFAMGTYVEPDTFNITSGDYRFRRYLDETAPDDAFWVWEILRTADNVRLWYYESSAASPTSTAILNPVSGTGATGTVELYVHDLAVYARYVVDTETAFGLTAYPIPDDDLVPNNRNYHYVIGYYFPDTIFFNSELSETPTQWGLYQPGKYYEQFVNALIGVGESFPIARSAWGRISLWFAFDTVDWIVEQGWRKQFTINDAFPIYSVISVLLEKIGAGVTFEGTQEYSQFLYGITPISLSRRNQELIITPKSNVISSGYSQPAQKAMITLKDVFDMLRDCFRCYWYIDDDNRLRIEHIMFFMLGGTYTSYPVVGIDLVEETAPRNGKQWAFGTSKYRFDKPEMAARYQFGWMDDVTQLFEGYPIDILSKFVDPDKIEQISVAKFTSDIDYILLNPGEISKDGFVLMSASKDASNIPSGGTLNGYFFATTGRFYTSDSGNVLEYYPVSKGDRVKITALIRSNYTDFYAFASFLDGEVPTTSGRIAQVIHVFSGIETYEEFFTAPEDGYIYLQTRLNSVVQTASPVVSFDEYSLPYYNYVVNGNDHYLQNAYVAFCMLQAFYDYDMPAPNYSINGSTITAQGVRKLRLQDVSFPALRDPNPIELIRTHLGNGAIQKLSVNLSSRHASATLKYDYE